MMMDIWKIVPAATPIPLPASDLMGVAEPNSVVATAVRTSGSQTISAALKSVYMYTPFTPLRLRHLSPFGEAR